MSRGMLPAVARPPKTCAYVACGAPVTPGQPHYPWCSGRCRSRGEELRTSQLHVLPVRAGERISQEARGGGVVSRAALTDGLLVRKGDEPGVFLPKAVVTQALAILDGTPRKANGHGR